MSISTEAILQALSSETKQLGIYDRVLRHEPKNPPGDGLTCSIYMTSLAPVMASGLNRTAALMIVGVRAQLPMLTEPQDDVDLRVTRAVDKTIESYCGAFTLGGLIRAVDIKGMAGTPIRVDYGYLDQGGTLYRFGEITTPLIVNDAWSHTA